MSQIPILDGSIASQSQNDSTSSGGAIGDLGIDHFLDLMMAELQNQDPLNPLENHELLAQISQIREVGATEKLTETLSAVLLGQNITSAVSLIGANVEAISDDNQRVDGTVQRISIIDGKPKLHIDERPGVGVSQEPGELDEGSYRYRIVWEDSGGNRFGVETEQAIEISGSQKAVDISNLPETNVPKRIYRTKADGTGPYQLVAILPDGRTSSYLDTTSDEDLLPTALNDGGIQFLTEPTRSFTVSLNNVGEIRPPQ